MEEGKGKKKGKGKYNGKGYDWSSGAWGLAMDLVEDEVAKERERKEKAKVRASSKKRQKIKERARKAKLAVIIAPCVMDMVTGVKSAPIEWM